MQPSQKPCLIMCASQCMHGVEGNHKLNYAQKVKYCSVNYRVSTTQQRAWIEERIKRSTDECPIDLLENTKVSVLDKMAISIRGSS